MLVIKSRRQTANTNFSVFFFLAKTKFHLVKILGVTVDSHLCWDSYVGIVVQRCNVILIGLARLRHKLPKCTRQLLVESLVFPHIRYCLTVWGSCSASLKARVPKVINSGACVVSGLGRRDHVTPVLRELGWGTVNEMLRERDIAVMSRLLSPECKAQVLTEQLLYRSDVSARQNAVVNGQLQLPRVRTEFARRSFMYRAVSAWNSESVLNG